MMGDMEPFLLTTLETSILQGQCIPLWGFWCSTGHMFMLCGMLGFRGHIALTPALDLTTLFKVICLTLLSFGSPFLRALQL